MEEVSRRMGLDMKNNSEKREGCIHQDQQIPGKRSSLRSLMKQETELNLKGSASVEKSGAQLSSKINLYKKTAIGQSIRSQG